MALQTGAQQLKCVRGRDELLLKCLEEGIGVRFHDDALNTVVFLGREKKPDADGSTFSPGGTGFLVQHEGAGYLVTAGHVAQHLENAPFVIRINRNDGALEELKGDYTHWAFHPDATVDLAAVEFHITKEHHDLLAHYIPTDELLTPEGVERYDVGVGDLTYTVGMFTKVYGRQRNIPLVHHGNIAMMPHEKFPIPDWHIGAPQSDVEVLAYLVQTPTLSGASGSPVFVRSAMDFSGLHDSQDTSEHARLARKNARLLGVWSGSWQMPPDQIIAKDRRNPERVPVGFGFVVPAWQIIELLDGEPFKGWRAAIEVEKRERAARS